MLSNASSYEPSYKSQAPVLLTPPPIAPTGIALQSMVGSPETECDLESFASALSVRDIIFECEGEGPMAQHPAFAGAVRQVIGSELMKTASKEALGRIPCPWGPACGLHVFFNGQKGTKPLEIPPPWVILSETTGANSLRITLRLFGLGLLWCGELAEACHRAIERGICLADFGPVCQSVLLRSIEDVWTGLQDKPPAARHALVSLVTPLGLPEDNNNLTPGQSFLDGLAKRSVSIARWHGINLVEDIDGLRELASHCEINEAGLGEIEWNRTLSQRGGDAIAMKGQIGLLQIQLPQDGRALLIRLLQIGALLNAGRKIAFGQGRYDLFLVP